MNIGILLFEDNEELRESIVSLIQSLPDFLILGSYSTATEAELRVDEARPDVVLMDIDLPGRNGIEAVKEIKKIVPDSLILMLTVFDDNDHIFQAICAGASGYLLKKHLSDKLETSIREIIAGGSPMSPGIARKVIETFQARSGRSGDSYNLTSREQDVLSLLARGNSYKMIASALKVSIETIRTHSKKIYEKLQVHSQTEAVSKAINERLV